MSETKPRTWEEDRRILLEKEAKRESVGYKTFREILAERLGAKEIYVPFWDTKIRYGSLTMSEWAEIDRIEDVTEKSYRMLFHIWKKGDETVTWEGIKELPADEVSLVLGLIMSEHPLVKHADILKSLRSKTQTLVS